MLYSTPIPVCLWFLSRNKNNTAFRQRAHEILFIDASRLGKTLSRTASYLDFDDIEKISATYHNWKTLGGNYEDTPGFCRSVGIEEIRSGEYILFPAKYVGIDYEPDVVSKPEIFKQISNKLNKYQKILNELDETISAVNDCFIAAGSKISIPLPDEFVTLKLEDVLEISEERLGERSEPEILTCTEKAGLIFQKERFAKRVATDNTSKYKVVRKTDVVYNPYLLWAGAIDQCWIVDMGITSPAYEVLKIKTGYNPSLIGFLLKSERLIKMYNGISIGTIQRRRRAPVEKFLQLEVELPSLKEQSKFLNISQAIQKESFLLRETDQLLSKLNKGLSRYWLINHNKK